ncbi:MAG TPA: hypothetical protein VGZ51_02675, partial [Actinomycetota bacterium]|nr:hypothetical protein [Actinomycetota bacterium]
MNPFFEFSAFGAAEYECSLDAEPFEQCDSPMEYSDLNPGTHVFRVRAVDLARNVEHPPVSHTFEVGADSTPPETTILSGPPNPSIDDWATFELQANEEVVYFECAIETEPGVGPVWEECFNPAQYTELLPGDYVLQVRAVDLALNVDPTPATYAWTYEPPGWALDTTIHRAPTNPSTNVNPFFEFSAFGAAEYECSLDAEPFESCESPYLLEQMTPGLHVFQVRAVDINGNVEAEPARHEWRLVSPPLEPTITVTPPDPSPGPEHTFEFTSTEPNATFECRITPNPFLQNEFQPCSSPHTYTNLPDGDYLFEVIAVNEYGIKGELPAQWDLTVAAAPDTAIHHGPSSPTARTTASFAFTSSEPGSVFICYLDGVELGECLSPAMFPDTELGFPSIGLGTHTFEVAAEDVDGNVDPTPASWTWTVVEGTAPDTVITGTPDDPTTETSASFGFFSTEPNSTFMCSLDGAALEACTSPAQYVGLAVGVHEFQVVATDEEGTA